MDSYSSMFSKGFWKDLKAYYDEARTYETLEAGLRKSVRNNPRFYPMFFNHGSTCKLLYAAGANRDSSFLSCLVLFVSVILASVKKDNLSTKILWWFRFRFLELTGKENVLTKFAKQFYNYTNKNRLGDDWEKQLFAAYYPEGHPFHELRSTISRKKI
jgi:hypothetical protein